MANTEVVTVGVEAAQKDYGKLLYELSESRSCCKMISSDEINLKFYQNLVTFRSQTRLLCYPFGYYNVAIPKHKIVGVRFSKLDPSKYFWLGLLLAIIGLLLAILSDGKTDMLVVGIMLLVVAALVIILPCFRHKYTICLELSHEEETVTKRFRNFFAKMIDPNQATDQLVIKTSEAPDDAFIRESATTPRAHLGV